MNFKSSLHQLNQLVEAFLLDLKASSLFCIIHRCREHLAFEQFHQETDNSNKS